jgi:hypothetical protein
MSDELKETIEIRPAHPQDERALTRLAQLDSTRVPPAPLLLAFEGGKLRAAMSLAAGTAIADPFAPTARLVDLLRTQSAPRERHPRRRPRLQPIQRYARASRLEAVERAAL